MKNEKLKNWLKNEIQSLESKELQLHLKNKGNSDLEWYIKGMRVQTEVILELLEKEQE